MNTYLVCPSKPQLLLEKGLASSAGFDVSNTSMEMESAEENHSDDPINEDAPADELTSPGFSDENDMFGVRKILPRVGDQYQAEIPDLIPDCDHSQQMSKPANPQFVVDNDSFSIGLPLLIMWIRSTVDTKTESAELLGDPNVVMTEEGALELNHSRAEKTDMLDGHAMLKGESYNVALNIGTQVGDSSGCKILVGGVPNEVDSHLPQDEKPILDRWRIKGCYLAPGTLCGPWSKIEQESFLLGLYTFGKNLDLIKGFIETREMGDILSFYYGKFYRSDAYRRWSDNRKKKRRRKCVYGKRIFTGWRQQELLSRLLPHVSDECQNTLLEVSRTFEEGEISLELYVSSLKSNVGMELLIESVRIGKGKQDLTTKVAERKKANQFKEQSGKSCSSLTSVDIIKSLKGDSRLSKTRSKDLFWEAVWPRLLANGWHSEQPKNHIYAGPKKPLVFLIPGIKKFSRRRLVKGEHYFDSFTDILQKIASEPTLIEIEVEAEKDSSSSEEHGCSTKRKLDHDGHSDHQRQRFLQPQNANSDQMKFTIVDTSMVEGEPLAVVKQRTLPAKLANTLCRPKKSHKISSSTSVSMKNEGSRSRKSVKKLGCSDIQFNNHGGTKIPSSTKGICDGVVCSDSLCCTDSASKQGFPSKGLNSARALMDNPSNLPNKTIKHQFSRRAKVGRSNSLDPATKVRSLVACSRDEVSKRKNRFETGIGLKADELNLWLGLPDMSDRFSKFCPSHEKLATSSSIGDKSDDRNERFIGEKSFPTKASHEKIQRGVLLDLNLPAPPDYDNAEPFTTEMTDVRDDPSKNQPASNSEATPPPEDSQALRISTGEQKPDIISRRQSTRNRPLTTKALEAIESDLLPSPKKRRHFEAASLDNFAPKPPRRVRRKVSNTTNFSDATPRISESSVIEGLEEGCSCGTNLIDKAQTWTERVS